MTLIDSVRFRNRLQRGWSIAIDCSRDAILLAILFLTPAMAIAQPLIGHNSCSSVGCHGGTQGKGPAWSFSLSSYLLNDPHARAYHLLWRDDSVRIVHAYQASVGEPSDQITHRKSQKLSTGPQYDAFINEHCATCHSSVQPSVPSQNLKMISCESCHGSARDPEGWLAQHVAGREKSNVSTWKNFVDLRDLSTRAQACSNCHVGSVASEDQPHRQVTHDLIAAGHPALRFEFASYLASLPPHWDEVRDRNLMGDESNSQPADTFWRDAWNVGKTAAVNRNLELLLDQLTKIDNPQPSHSRAELAFPDFAQYDCFSCHRDLSVKLLNRQQATRGMPHWLSWHAHGLRESDQQQLASVRAALTQFRRPRTISRLQPPVLEPRRANKAISVSNLPTWEQATAGYLAYLACYLDFRDASQSHGDVPPRIKNVDAATLGEYRRLLEITAAEHLRFSDDGSIVSPFKYQRQMRQANSETPAPIKQRLDAMKAAADEMKLRIGK